MNINEIEVKLKDYHPSGIVFLGLGNELRGDDWAGVYFLRKLKLSGVFSKSHFIEAGISPENYITTVLDLSPSAIVFIDAADFSNSAGEINFIDPTVIEISGYSTHSYSIRLIEDFFTYCGDIDFFYIGIVPSKMNTGDKLSPVVQNSIDNFFRADK